MRFASVCLLIVYASFLPSIESQSSRFNEKKTEAKGNQNKTEGKANPIPQTTPSAVSVTQIAPISVTNWPQQERGNPWWNAVVTNWPLIVIGVLGTVAALLTLGVIRRQTTALINAERAWLFISSDFRPIATSPKFDWSITNHGKTTAIIEQTSVRCETRRPMAPFPDIPEYRDPIEVKKVPIAPKQKLGFWSYFDTQGDNPTELSNQDSLRILDGTLDLVFYGYVKYTDSFGKPHESRFCYYFVYWCSEFRTNLTAPAEYHRCT